ncbi:UNVERIFIED_CONTAM: hypothetical protein FKN15_046394 [Acipenser sinensis]
MTNSPRPPATAKGCREHPPDGAVESCSSPSLTHSVMKGADIVFMYCLVSYIPDRWTVKPKRKKESGLEQK